MFDIGFWEMLLIVILALLVIGPERLPGAAKKAGYWLGRGRRFVEGVRSDVESQVDIGEFKRLLHNQEVQINELQEKLKTGISDVEGAASKLESQVLTDVPSHKFEPKDEVGDDKILEKSVSSSRVSTADSNEAESGENSRSGNPS